MMHNDFVQALIRFLPFLILIAVWIFFLRKMGGGADFRNKCLDHMAAQTESQQQIAQILQRIATALEQRKS